MKEGITLNRQEKPRAQGFHAGYGAWPQCDRPKQRTRLMQLMSGSAAELDIRKANAETWLRSFEKACDRRPRHGNVLLLGIGSRVMCYVRGM